MKETIAFPKLVELVAQKANTTERMSELFLQELFAVVTQELNEEKSVKINGVGSFKITKDESEKDIVFTPDKELAEAVNAPFAQFEPVELCDEVTDEMLNEIDASLEQPVQDEKVTTEHVSSENDIHNVVIEPNPTNEETHNGSEDVAARHTLTAQEQQEQKNPQEEPVTQDTESRNPRTWIIAAAAAIALIAVWYFYTHRSKNVPDRQQVENTQVTTNNISKESKKSEEIKPQPVVTDTIGNGNVLFTMAKKHYGDQAFWVYIARENQAQYPDYRKISSGAILVIPPAEKYGINSDSKQSLKQAGIEAMKLYKEVKAADQNVPAQASSSTSSTKTVTPTKQSQWKGNSKKNYRHHNRSAHNRFRRR